MTSTTTAAPLVEQEELRQLRLLSILGAVHQAEHRDALGSYFGRGRLPAELFLKIATFVDWDDLIVMSRVCSAWRKELIGYPKLWNTLELDLSQKTSIDKAREISKRAAGIGRGEGGLKELELHLDGAIDGISPDYPLVEVSRCALAEVSRWDGGTSIEKVSLNLDNYELDDSLPALQLISQLATFLKAAVNNNSVRRLNITAFAGTFPSGSSLFSALPSLHELEVSSRYEDDYFPEILPALFRPNSDTQPQECQLQKLRLLRTTLPNTNYPSLPHLSTVELANVEVSNLYALIKSCSHALKILNLSDVMSEPPSNFFPFNESDPKDQPPVIELPRLRSVKLSGLCPFLWTTPKTGSSSFAISAPSLRVVNFSGNTVADGSLSAWFERSGADYLPFVDLTTENLILLLRTSPSIEVLNLRGTNVNDIMLKKALPYASRGLRVLKLGASVTDELIDILHYFLPRLEELEVWDSGANISLQALSRFASRLVSQNIGGHLVLATSQPFPPPKDSSISPALRTLRNTLRSHLISLSQSQLEHLSNSVVLNLPPDAPSFEFIKQEIINLGSPDPLPPYAINKNEERWRGWTNAKRMTATEDIVQAARHALSAWQLRREQEWAIEWASKTERVHLIWGCITSDEEEDDDEEEEVGPEAENDEPAGGGVV